MMFLVGRAVRGALVEIAEGYYEEVWLVVTGPGFDGGCGYQYLCCRNVVMDWRQPDHISRGSPSEMA